MATDMYGNELKVGDKVTNTSETTVDGTHLQSWVYNGTVFDVMGIGWQSWPDGLILGNNGGVTAVVPASACVLLGATPKPVVPEEQEVIPPVDTTESLGDLDELEEDAFTSEEIESELKKFLNANADDYLRYNMRLLGIPNQYTKYCDYRTFSTRQSQIGRAVAIVGRKFIENIMLEAPVVTIIPGVPDYLPAATDRHGMSAALLGSANADFARIAPTISAALKNEGDLQEALRYYDFKSDYYSYISYVNVLCSAAAAFLELNNKYYYNIDGVGFTSYNWKNYRWNATGYTTAVGNLIQNSEVVGNAFVDVFKAGGQQFVDFFHGDATLAETVGLSWINDIPGSKEGDSSMIEELEDLLQQTNFVQFYIDPISGFSDNGENQTSESKIASALSSGQELMKEIAFIANSGGIDATAMQEELGQGLSTLSDNLFKDGQGAISGIFSRLLNSSSSIIKGENLIFPEIYQSSSYSKSYNITIDLRSPYGNRLAYYINVLVPLFHLLALAIPKQGTANTYSSPFVLKAYMPGVFACNLGMVQSIQIDKCPNGDAWTVDGYPSHIKVSLTIKDLYSDLTLTPASNPTLFMANSSLIEYIATSCGVNLSTPQLKNRMELFTSVLSTYWDVQLPDTIESSIMKSIEPYISSLTGNNQG